LINQFEGNTLKTGDQLIDSLGPGLITGAADDDPSGIATYSQAGAQFRFGLVWTLLLTTPLMIGIQMLSARIGWITGKGLSSNIHHICSSQVFRLGCNRFDVCCRAVNVCHHVILGFSCNDIYPQKLCYERYIF